MFGKNLVTDMISRSSENENDRRNFLRAAGVAGLGVVGGAALLGSSAGKAEAAAPSDGAVLNFALNLEYLEAQFYSYAVHGKGLPSFMLTGSGKQGRVIGGHKVPFKTRRIAQFAAEIAGDEYAHVKFLRAALGGAKVSQPKIDLRDSFTAAAQAAGLIKKGQTFDPFASEGNFLLGAYIFEDVGVTAYKAAAPLISNKTYLEAAAGILAVEAYHAGTVRTTLYENSAYWGPARKISAARDSLDGPSETDMGIHWSGGSNITPVSGNAIAFSRSPGKVLNVVYLTPKQVSKGGFFPDGMNGAVKMSAKSS